jgi:MFS family permease
MRKIEIVIWVGIALETILFSGILPVLPDIGETAGLSVQLLGVLLGAYAFSTLFFCIPFGLLSDRRNPRLIFTICLAGLAGGALLIGLYPTPLGIGVGRLLQGIAGAGVWTAGLAVAGIVAGPAARGRAVAGVFSAATAGEILGPLVGGVLYERASSTSFYWAGAAAGLALTVAAAFILREPGWKRQTPETDKSSPEEPRAAATTVAVWGGLSLLVYFIFSLMLLALPVILAESFGRSPSEIGLVLTIWSLILFLSQIAGGQWSDRRGWAGPVLAGFLLAGSGLLILAFEPPIGLALAALIALAAGDGIAATVTTSLFSRSWEQRSPAGTGLGTSFGVVNTVWSLAFLLGSVLGGVILAQSLLQGLLFASGLVFTGLAGFFALRRWRRIRLREAAGAKAE